MREYFVFGNKGEKCENCPENCEFCDDSKSCKKCLFGHKFDQKLKVCVLSYLALFEIFIGFLMFLGFFWVLWKFLKYGLKKEKRIGRSGVFKEEEVKRGK